MRPRFAPSRCPRRQGGCCLAATRTVLLHGADRELVVQDADRRRALWTSRVWPGAVLVEGELVGTWRRDQGTVTVRPWRRLTRVERDAVAAEAESLPLPGVEGGMAVWEA